MIEIYLKTNTNYSNNGDITLDPTSCTYKDSQKELTLEHFIDDEGRWKYIEFENVIAVEENGKKILYRIYNVVRSLYSVTAYARPLFYDLIDKVLLDVRPTEKIAQEALDIILDGTGFKGHSNLASISTSYYIRKNIVEALLGGRENSFINRWGGEFYCENFDVYINDRIGSNNGVRVEFGYNLNEIEEDINIEDVVTRIIPVGYDGIMLEGDTPWIDSPLINKYTHVKMRVIGFSDVKVKEHIDDEEGFNTIEEARAELVKRCKQLLKDGIDKPTVNYKIDMINLANTTAYEDFKMLVNVNKGDTVTCYIPHLDIDVQARVIDFEKDLLTGEYISIELGTETTDFFKEQSDIQNKVDNIFNSNGNVKAETLEGAINALQTKFKALRDVAQPQQVRAIMFEDRIEDSSSFGCLAIGTMGFQIASSFKPGTTDWDFRTFGTGKGFVADEIISGVLNASLIKAGILESENGKSKINMKDGTFNFADKIKFDGKAFTIDLSGENLASNESIKLAFKAMNDSISLKAEKSEISEAVDNIQVGGRNLILNSNTPVSSNSYLLKEYTLSENWIEGEEYTFVIKGTLPGKQKFGVWMNGGNTFLGFAETVYSKDVTYVTFLGKAPTNGREKSISLFNYPSQTIPSTKATIKWVALYKGNKPTDWTPAPEDVDSNISNLTKRVEKAELKVSEKEITATVSKTFLSKTDASSTYATKSSLKQTSDSIEAKFSSSGGYNVVKNSGFKNGLTGWWKGEYQPNGTNRSIDVWGDSSPWVLDGTRALVIRSTNNTSGEFRVDSQKFKVKQHTDYTISYLVAGHRVTSIGHHVRGNEWEIIDSVRYQPKTGGKDRNNWTRITRTFNTGSNHQISVNFFHWNTQDNAYSWVTDVMINEGDMALPWTPRHSEIYEGSTTIDANGVTIKNGALKVTNSNGVATIDGSKLMFRLKTWGNGSIVIPNNSQTATVTIPHNLGFAPVFKGQVGYISNSGETEYYSDAFSLYSTDTGTAIYNVRMFVTTTYLKVIAWRAKNLANSGTKTFYYRWFLEEGVNL